jgi:hypothetical protein
MRSIGVKNRNLVKKLVAEANNKDIIGDKEVFEYVQDALPVKVFEIWEGAYTEIEHLCWEYNNQGTAW